MKTREYFLIFTVGDQWIAKFLKKGFGHMKVVMRDQYNWVEFDPRIWGLNTTVLPYAASNMDCLKLYKDATCIMKVETNQKCSWFFRPFFGSCVSLIKYVMGIKAFAFTPYQLFKELKWQPQYKTEVVKGE